MTFWYFYAINRIDMKPKVCFIIVICLLFNILCPLSQVNAQNNSVFGQVKVHSEESYVSDSIANLSTLIMTSIMDKAFPLGSKPQKEKQSKPQKDDSQKAYLQTTRTITKLATSFLSSVDVNVVNLAVMEDTNSGGNHFIGLNISKVCFLAMLFYLLPRGAIDSSIFHVNMCV